MNQNQNTDKNKLVKRIVTISVGCLLGLGFVGNICYAIFSGGEFKEEKKVAKIPGMLRLVESDYIDSYLVGDTLSFDKEASKVSLVCKDPTKEELVKIDDLPMQDYGFMTSHYQDEKGNIVSRKTALADEKKDYQEVFSDFYENASEVKLDKDIIDVYVVSKEYQDLKSPLNISVENGHLDESLLSREAVLEAEEADVYMEDKLLSQDELATLPDQAKPFLSDAGESPVEDGFADQLSGNACLRNFQSYNMKVDFPFVSSFDGEVSLTIRYCNRKESKTFDSYFKVLVNNKSYEEINNQKTIQGNDFFTPRMLSKVNVKVHRGLNHVTMESGTSLNRTNPVNLDCLMLESEQDGIAGREAIVMED